MGEDMCVDWLNCELLEDIARVECDWLAEREEEGSSIEVLDGVAENEMVDVGDAVEESVNVNVSDDKVLDEDLDLVGIVELAHSTLFVFVRVSVTISVASDAEMSCAASTILILGSCDTSGLLVPLFVTTTSMVVVGPSILVVNNVVVAGSGAFSEAVTVSVWSFVFMLIIVVAASAMSGELDGEELPSELPSTAMTEYLARGWTARSCGENGRAFDGRSNEREKAAKRDSVARIEGEL